jgi:hypothetical protein
VGREEEEIQGINNPFINFIKYAKVKIIHHEQNMGFFEIGALIIK